MFAILKPTWFFSPDSIPRSPPEKTTRPRPLWSLFARAVVNPSMTAPRGPAPRAGISAADEVIAGRRRSRHAKCTGKERGRNVSRSGVEGVDFGHACSMQVFPQQGIHSSHGHPGRFLVRVRFPVVSSPGCEAFFPQGHFFRGPGVRAALTTVVASPMSALMKMPAWATRPGRARPIRATSFPRCSRNVRQPEETHKSPARARVCDG